MILIGHLILLSGLRSFGRAEHPALGSLCMHAQSLLLSCFVRPDATGVKAASSDGVGVRWQKIQTCK